MISKLDLTKCALVFGARVMGASLVVANDKPQHVARRVRVVGFIGQFIWHLESLWISRR